MQAYSGYIAVQKQALESAAQQKCTGKFAYLEDIRKCSFGKSVTGF